MHHPCGQILLLKKRCANKRPQSESAWPPMLRAEFRDVEVGIARTRSAWGGLAEVREIEALFIEHIRRAKRFIYAESQYFASRRVAEALAERPAVITFCDWLLAEAAEERDE